jgi:hypothetical protein
MSGVRVHVMSGVRVSKERLGLQKSDVVGRIRHEGEIDLCAPCGIPSGSSSS